MISCLLGPVNIVGEDTNNGQTPIMARCQQWLDTTKEPDSNDDLEFI